MFHRMTPLRLGRDRTTVLKLSRFAYNENGAITVFAVLMVLMMLMVCGIAVDLMQNELMRTRVQNTLDRAILAASDLDQPLLPGDVVDDYFAKAGMTDFLETVEIAQVDDLSTVTDRAVRATARTETPSIYMAMTGVYSLPVYAVGVAEETIKDKEISLVLDISGSMRNNGKIDNLRTAAKEFIDIVLTGNATEITSLNIIPYAGETNPGPLVFQRAGGTLFETYINDENGDPVVYGIPMLDEGGNPVLDADGNEIVVPYNTFSSCLNLNDNDFNNINLPSGGYTQTAYFMNWPIHAPTMDWGWCPQHKSSIRYAQNNAETLKTFIDEMRLHDGTGTQNGMKYGVALLNPSSNATFRALNLEGSVPDDFIDRPASFDNKETRKYIVLMTDGQITDQYRPIDRVNPLNANTALNQRSGDRHSPLNHSDNVENFKSICDQAKANGIIVYTIAFEAPAPATEQMKDCASEPAFAFDVDGKEISAAFKAIARRINQLRLTQ
ncbi:MAG: Tad domain-containing protein [Roseobacter sp.]